MIDIKPTIMTIGHEGEVIRTFTFTAVVTHSDFPNVSTTFGGEPLVDLPRGTDLVEYVTMQYRHNHDFVRHMVNVLEFEYIKSNVVVDLVPLTPEEERERMPPISKRQLRLTLVRNGISLADLDAAILTMGDEAIIEWQDASEYHRLHPLLNQVADHLSLTQAQVDMMWRQAMAA